MRETYNCPTCNTPHSTKLVEASVLACIKCGSEILLKNQSSKIQKTIMPADWSFIKIGTTGTYQEKYFTIIGCVRLQLRNDYKIFWCAEYDHGKHFYLADSFSSLATFEPSWNEYSGDASKLRSGSSIKFNADTRIIGEFVEKCEGIAMQGEIGNWKNFLPDFFVVQASSNNGKIAIYFITPKKECVFITGEKTDPKKLKLENIVNYNDWR